MESKCLGADAVQSGHAGLLICQQKNGNDYEKRVHAGQRQACVGHLANRLVLRLVLRLSLQSKNETDDPLKSGPALAGPAGLATPPLYFLLTQTHCFLPLIHIHQMHVTIKYTKVF